MPPPLKFDDVQVMLADPRTHIRSALKVALTHAGIDNIEHTGSMEAVTDAIEHSIGPDILICDMGLDDGEICETISEIRHNDLGMNPFLCIIGVTWKPEAKDVVRMINCGIDHLIRAPMSPQQIMARITSLVHHRLPFIVTADYVGPDRRKTLRPDMDLSVVDVPNTLRAKTTGTWNPRQFERELSGAIGKVNTRKIDRQAAIIEQLADMIATQAAEENGAARVRPLVERLTHLVIEMDRRAQEYGFHHVSELCKACVSVVKELQETGTAPRAKDMELLTHLGMAIRAALSPAERAPRIAHDIATIVASR